MSKLEIVAKIIQLKIAKKKISFNLHTIYIYIDIQLNDSITKIKVVRSR